MTDTDRTDAERMLCTATTAPRDIHMGWDADEIVDLEGGSGGLPNLVRGLVTELRCRGIDDEGGWDCPETSHISVARPPGLR